MEQNKDAPYVINGLVFAQPTGKPGDMESQIRSHRKQTSGMEPLDLNNMPLEFQKKIATADAPQ